MQLPKGSGCKGTPAPVPLATFARVLYSIEHGRRLGTFCLRRPKTRISPGLCKLRPATLAPGNGSTRMKSLAMAAALLGLFNLSTAPTLNSFRYNREVLSPTASTENASPNACAVLDANVFAHTQSGLADLRVFDPAGKTEIPYVVTLSSTAPTSDPARIVRVSPSGAQQLTADLEMPRRSYSQVDLGFNAKNFVASVHVTGLRTLTDASPVFLGDVTLFDLTAQHLGSSLSIPMAESTFPYLHLRLMFKPAPGNSALLITSSTLASAEVPPARVAQTLYTGIAQSFSIAQRGQQTVVAFRVPAHVPIERVSFDSIPRRRRTSTAGSRFPPPPVSQARKRR